MADKARDALKTILSILISAILALIGVLWTMNYDYVKKVDAKCASLEKEKADRPEIREIKDAIISMDKKFDSKFEKLSEKIDRLRR